MKIYKSLFLTITLLVPTALEARCVKCPIIPPNKTMICVGKSCGIQQGEWGGEIENTTGTIQINPLLDKKAPNGVPMCIYPIQNRKKPVSLTNKTLKECTVSSTPGCDFDCAD